MQGSMQNRPLQSSPSYMPVRSQSADKQDFKEDAEFEQSAPSYQPIGPLGLAKARGRSMSETSQGSGSGGAGNRGRSGSIGGASAASDPIGMGGRRSWSPVDAPRRNSRGQRPGLSPEPVLEDRVRSASPALGSIGGGMALAGGKLGGSVGRSGSVGSRPGGSVAKPGGSVGVPGGMSRNQRPDSNEGTPSPGRQPETMPRKRSSDAKDRGTALGSGMMPKRRPSADQKVGGSVAKVGGSVASVGSSVASVGRKPGNSLAEPSGISPRPKGGQGQAVPQGAPAQAPGEGPDIPRMRLSVLSLGWAFGAVSWVLGMAFHSISILVMPGTPLERKIHKSVFGSLEVLQENHAWLSYCMLGTFSVVVPLLKICGTLWLIYLTANMPVRKAFEENKYTGKFLKLTSSYQFVDLYVAILFIAFFNSDSSDASVGIGFYFFFNYCLVSTAVSALLEDTFLRMKGLEEKQAAAKDQEAQLQCLRSTVEDGYDYVHASLELGAAAASAAGNLEARQVTQEVPELGGKQDIKPSDALLAEAQASSSSLDRRAVYFFSSLSMILFFACSFSEWLELRLMLNGVSLDRNPLTIVGLLFYLLPSCVQPAVMVFVWLFVCVFPFLYATCLCLRAGLKNPPASVVSCLSTVTDWLRQWAMLDVFAIASMITLCMLQDENTLTFPGDGSYAYYVFLASSYSFFFLRWFVEGQFSDWCFSVAPNGKFWLIAALWLGTCVFLLHGVPGAYPHYQFPTLDAVCDHGSEVLNHMIPSLPNSFGNCTDRAAGPPKPCKGSEPLYDKGPDVTAVWIGGLNSMNVKSCSLTKKLLDSGRTAFSLSIAGVFSEIKLFLRVNTMGVHMDSPDHCCGKDIRYSMKLVLDCIPDAERGAIKGIRLESFDISSMYVEEKIGMLTIDAMDLSTLLKKLVKDRINIVVNKVHLSWAGQQLKLPEMLDKLVSYNAPERWGQC